MRIRVCVRVRVSVLERRHGTALKMDGLCDTVCRKGRYKERGTVEHDLRERHLKTEDQEGSTHMSGVDALSRLR